MLKLIKRIQYDRFVDKEAALTTQLDAWKAMLQHSQGSLSTKETLAAMTLGKYKNACKVVNTCHDQLSTDQKIIEDLQIAFQEGIEAWKQKLIKQAVVKILTGLLSTF